MKPLDVKPIRKNRQIILGNNLKTEAIIPKELTQTGDGYVILDFTLPKKEIEEVKRHYKNVIMKDRQILIRKNIIKNGKKEIRNVYKHVRILSFVTKTDENIRTNVYDMMRSRDSFKYTMKLIQYMKDNYRNMFTKEANIEKIYTFYIHKNNKKVRKKVMFIYPAITINESLKTFLKASDIEQWYVGPTHYLELDRYHFVRMDVDKSIMELEEFFKKDNTNCMEWDEYASNEIKRLWNVTNGGSV